MIVLHADADGVGAGCASAEAQAGLAETRGEGGGVCESDGRGASCSRIAADEILGIRSPCKVTAAGKAVRGRPLRGGAIAIKSARELVGPRGKREPTQRGITPAALIVLHADADGVGAGCPTVETQAGLAETRGEGGGVCECDGRGASRSGIAADEILGAHYLSRMHTSPPEQERSYKGLEGCGCGNHRHFLGDKNGNQGALTAWPSLRITSVSTPSRTASGERSKEITTGFSVVQPSGSNHAPPDGPMSLRLPSRSL